jgi:hypothetical protein
MLAADEMADLAHGAVLPELRACVAQAPDFLRS